MICGTRSTLIDIILNRRRDYPRPTCSIAIEKILAGEILNKPILAHFLKQITYIYVEFIDLKLHSMYLTNNRNNLIKRCE